MSNLTVVQFTCNNITDTVIATSYQEALLFYSNHISENVEEVISDFEIEVMTTEQMESYYIVEPYQNCEFNDKLVERYENRGYDGYKIISTLKHYVDHYKLNVPNIIVTSDF